MTAENPELRDPAPEGGLVPMHLRHTCKVCPDTNLTPQVLRVSCAHRRGR
jgi:hypothetical protein